MSANITPPNNITRLDISANRVLELVKDKVDGGVLVIGWDTNGDLIFSSSIADGGEVLWLLEKTKKALLEVVNEHDL
tara:strand:- start:10390 stop:10620 length:231 start_codon:yes stop_codon:yes gene_type:complete